MITPDLAQASLFLSRLDENDEFTFQTFADHEGEPRPWPTVLHGSLDEHAHQLSSLNNVGAGIFVMVNAGDGLVHADAKTCRTAANVVRVRALFVDLDGAPICPVIDETHAPDWIVQSSPGRWHAYWKVGDCPLSEFGRAQAALAEKFEGDAKVKDLPRVMRVPGFVHQKKAPFVSRLYLPSEYSAVSRGEHA